MRGNVHNIKVSGMQISGGANIEMLKINGQDIRGGGEANVPAGESIEVEFDVDTGYSAHDSGCFAAWTSEHKRDKDEFMGGKTDYLPGFPPTLHLGIMPDRNVAIQFGLFATTKSGLPFPPEEMPWTAFPEPVW